MIYIFVLGFWVFDVSDDDDNDILFFSISRSECSLLVLFWAMSIANIWQTNLSK